LYNGVVTESAGEVSVSFARSVPDKDAPTNTLVHLHRQAPANAHESYNLLIWHRFGGPHFAAYMTEADP
jgi:hypothetical protein